MTLIELDSFVLLHGPFTSVEECQVTNALNKTEGSKSVVKRKGGMNNVVEPPARRARQPAYFLADVAHVVALCDERIPFVSLAQELTRRDIAHQVYNLLSIYFSISRCRTQYSHLLGIGTSKNHFDIFLFLRE